MNLIKVTPLVKGRTKKMLKDLLPKYGYVRITNRGVVILKKTIWSFKKITLNITDLYIDVLPNKLADSCKRKGYGDTYDRVFSNDLYVMLQIKAYRKTIDIVDYVWNKYNLLHREVPVIQVTEEFASLSYSKNRYLPVLSPVSGLFIPGVETLFKRIRKQDSVESLIEKISKIQIRSPKMLHEASRFIIRIKGLQYA